MNPHAREALYRAAGAENVSDALADRVLYASDATKEFHPPAAVVRATGTRQVSRVLAACSRLGLPVVARGAGSGLTGGALALKGGVVLDLAGMNRILEINQADQVAVVQPGVVTADLQAAAQARGLFYPPDPASVGFCSVGGNVAENAGGLRAVKYGVTRDYVLGLTAVLMDGRIFRTGGRTIKSVVGYDLTRLLVGSEGTLAVLTEITLRLIPLPESRGTVRACFPDPEAAARGIQDLLGSGIVPTAIEFMDAATLAAVEAYAPTGLPPGVQALVLVDVDGPPEVVARQVGQVADLLTRTGGDPVSRALDREEVEDLWRARRAAGPAISRISPDKINEDVVVPLGRLAEMTRRMGEVQRERGVKVVCFGHAGDGNLHVNIMYDAGDPAQLAGAHQAASDVFAHALALKGSLSGEHGIGIKKLGYVGAETDPVAMELMRQVKRAFDPQGLLNPGKLLPPE